MIALSYCLLLVVGIALVPNVAVSHEFWLQTLQTDLDRGDDIEVRGYVGQNFVGNEMIYSDRSVRNFGFLHDGTRAPIVGTVGDRPMGRVERAERGLHVIGLESNASTVSYQTAEDFFEFARAHGNDEAIAAHAARDLPEENFKESYFRFAKTLVPVGTAEGRDTPLGLAFELTALTNPFTEPGSVRFLLSFQGKPVPDAQIDVFFVGPGGGAAVKEEYLTNALGEVVFETRPGRFLVNAVLLQAPGPRLAEALGVVWNSLWASTTFRIAE